MSPAAFRRIALSMPDAVEGTHMGHADFRVNGKVFATLGWPDKMFAMVKLPLELQDALLRAAPEAFEPASGAWGRQGSTLVRLARADETSLRDAIRSAWQNVAAAKSKARSRKRV
ncbi:MAG TPA: MmcQ/YjbR family DNA-binding protein [Rhizomicrobium sp.]|nr:MmcQ/YjbR family DNA-binding protein [Rhizomicrobium sp.]